MRLPLLNRSDKAGVLMPVIRRLTDGFALVLHALSVNDACLLWVYLLVFDIYVVIDIDIVMRISSLFQ